MDKNKITLLGGIDSLGVPFPRANTRHIGFFDLTVKYFTDLNYEIEYIDFFNVRLNHSWEFARFFKKNFNLAQIKKIQIKSLNYLRNANIFFKFAIPKKFVNRYSIIEDDYKIKIKDVYTNSKNPIIIYSCGFNDFTFYIKSGPVEILSKKVRDELPKNLYHLLDKTVNNVKTNIEMLLSLNPNAKIYVLGLFDCTTFKYIECLIYMQEKLNNRKVKFKRRINLLINCFNHKLQKLCKKYENTIFIDNTDLINQNALLDFHPNTKANKAIAQKIISQILIDLEV